VTCCDEKFIDKQIGRIEKQCVKCQFNDEIFAQYRHLSQQEFADIVTRVIKSHKFQNTFPNIAEFEEAIYSIAEDKKNKTEAKNKYSEEEENRRKQQKYASWIPATKAEKEESAAWIEFIAEVRAWYYFAAPVNFTGEMLPLKPLTYDDWKMLQIMGDYDGWIEAGRPPLPCPICNFFFISGEQFYKRQISRKDDTMRKYWLDCVRVLEEWRCERVPESKGKKIKRNSYFSLSSGSKYCNFFPENSIWFFKSKSVRE
jgi:hypothetical protein